LFRVVQCGSASTLVLREPIVVVNRYGHICSPMAAIHLGKERNCTKNVPLRG
jgi:hypothetical protein